MNKIGQNGQNDGQIVKRDKLDKIVKRDKIVKNGQNSKNGQNWTIWTK